MLVCFCEPHPQDRLQHITFASKRSKQAKKKGDEYGNRVLEPDVMELVVLVPRLKKLFWDKIHDAGLLDPKTEGGKGEEGCHLTRLGRERHLKWGK